MTYQFNGSTNYLEEVSADYSALPLTIFMRSSATSALSGNQTLMSIGNGTDGHQVMIRSSGNSIAQARHQNGAGTTGVNAGTAQTMNSWGTLVARFTSSTDRAIFDSGGKTTGGATSITGTAFDRLVVGCGISAAGAKTAFTQALINVLAIWNVDLTDDECLSLTKTAAPPLLVRPQSLIRLYNMENLNDYIKGAVLTPINSPVVNNTDPGRKRFPRRTKQSHY